MDCESGVNSLQFFKRSDVKVYILPRVCFFLLLIQVFLKALFRPNKLTLIIIPNYYRPDLAHVVHLQCQPFMMGNQQDGTQATVGLPNLPVMRLFV